MRLRCQCSNFFARRRKTSLPSRVTTSATLLSLPSCEMYTVKRCRPCRPASDFSVRSKYSALQDKEHHVPEGEQISETASSHTTWMLSAFYTRFVLL